MSPSQIVKSAYARAQQAGYSKSVKTFARQMGNNELIPGSGSAFVQMSEQERDACEDWLVRKAMQRKQAKQCARSARRGHNVVHEQQHNRSVANSLAGSMPMRGGHS
jgi:pyrroline-5-carboxylate reductase